MIFRTAEKVSVSSFSFTSLRFVSFWSGQLIVAVRLSPSFLTVKVEVRFCLPISYSHFHVPTGSTLSAARARPQSPSTNAIERIAFMIAFREMGKGRGEAQANTQSMRAIPWRPRPLVIHSNLDSLSRQGTCAAELVTFPAAGGRVVGVRLATLHPDKA